MVRYEIDADGIKSSGDDLTSVVKTAFVLERDTGVLKLNFEVLATMKGYFEFKIIAYDLGKCMCSFHTQSQFISWNKNITYVNGNRNIDKVKFTE